MVSFFRAAVRTPSRPLYCNLSLENAVNVPETRRFQCASCAGAAHELRTPDKSSNYFGTLLLSAAASEAPSEKPHAETVVEVLQTLGEKLQVFRLRRD